MARRRHRSQSNTWSVERELERALLERPRRLPSAPLRRELSDADVRSTDDARFYHPLGDARPLGSRVRSDRHLLVYGSAAVSGQKRGTRRIASPWAPSKEIRVFAEPGSAPAAIGVRRPRNVSICMRRKARREVMHAKGLNGGGNRKPRWNFRSFIRCK